MNLAFFPVSIKTYTGISPPMSNETLNKTRELFAKRLRAYRRDAGFKTARKFAAALNIDENRYTRYERAEVEPDLGLIARFCEMLGVTPNRLLGFDDGSCEPSVVNAPGFGDQSQQAVSGAREIGETAHVATGKVSTEAVRLAAWQLAEARARARDTRSDPVAQLRQTAILFDEVMSDPIGMVARLARDGEIERAPAPYRAEIANAADALIKQLTRERTAHPAASTRSDV